jgi:hypothetical protein
MKLVLGCSPSQSARVGSRSGSKLRAPANSSSTGCLLVSWRPSRIPDAERIDAKTTRTVWMTGGCSSWYLDSSGRNSTLWPGYATGFPLALPRFRTDDYTPAPSLAKGA